MKITINHDTVYAFATQRNATQRNLQLYLLTNNYLEFYLSQFFDFFLIIYTIAIWVLFYASI